jgi:hypothetical protein
MKVSKIMRRCRAIRKAGAVHEISFMSRIGTKPKCYYSSQRKMEPQPFVSEMESNVTYFLIKAAFQKPHILILSFLLQYYVKKYQA